MSRARHSQKWFYAVGGARVPLGESAARSENSLTFGLLWLDRARQIVRRCFVAGLRLNVPKGTSALIAHNARTLHPQTHLEIYELDARQEMLSHIDPRSAGNLELGWCPVERRRRFSIRPRPGSSRSWCYFPTSSLFIPPRRLVKCGCAFVAWRSLAGATGEYFWEVWMPGARSQTIAPQP
jgi:hypothetical protein